MKKIMTLMLALGLSIGLSHAAVETVITTTTNHKGEEEIQVEYREVTPDLTDAIESFQQADVNRDGCVDRGEAKDKGILKFDTYAKENPKCLNEEEYNRAMQGADIVVD